MNITKSDLATALARGSVGAIPIVGSLASEVLGLVIPNRRLDRIEALLNELSQQLGNRSADDVQARFNSPEFADVLEDAIGQSARALSQERIHRIAALLKNSLTDEELRHLQDKRVLDLLAELNDAELIILQSYSREARFDPDWLNNNAAVINPTPSYFGASQSEHDEATLQEQFREHLRQLGLLSATISPSSKPGGIPQFDDRTGLPKTSGYELTSLGLLLLRRIDVLGPTEF